MHYINTAAEISAIQARIVPGATPEEIYQAYIPLVRRAYQEGKAGMPGYPKDPAAEIAEYEAASGPLRPQEKDLIVAFLSAINVTYAEGRKAGGR